MLLSNNLSYFNLICSEEGMKLCQHPRSYHSFYKFCFILSFMNCIKRKLLMVFGWNHYCVFGL